MAGRYLLLNITAHGIDATTVERTFSKTRQKEYAFAPLDALQDPLEDASRYQQALTVIATQIDLTASAEAVVFISSQDVCFRNLSLPFTSPGKIFQVLPFELAPYLPGNDYVSAFVSQDVCFVQNQQLILTASVAASMVSDITACLEAYKIRPGLITPRGYALAVSYMETRKKTPDHIFIHLGPNDITFVLIAGSKPVMVRALAASDRMDDLVAETVFHMVTGFRQKSGLDTRFDLCLAPEQGSADTTEMTRKLTQMMSQHAFFRTDTITAMAPDTGAISDILFQTPRLVLNFSQKPYGPGAFFHKFRSEILATGVMGAIIFALLVFSLYQNIVGLEKQIAAIRDTSAGLYQKTFPQNEILPGHSPLLLMQARVKQALQQKGGTNRSRDMNQTPDIAAIDVLYELSSRIPSDMNAQLSRLLFNHGQVTISGNTDSFNTVDRLKNVLETSDIFKTVTINTADAGKTDDKIFFQFNISL
ncbi:MAG: PilN domain-containing protein [Desulfotignum sp.]|nr:PilN domain-containing protein [Desulfobacteraceae bacterium]